MLDIDQLMANMPKDEDELKTVQEKRRQILQENRDKETGMLPVALPTELSGFRYSFFRGRNLAKSAPLPARKARNHRLCEHGAILEAYFPQTIPMDSAQFAVFMQELAAGR